MFVLSATRSRLVNEETTTMIWGCGGHLAVPPLLALEGRVLRVLREDCNRSSNLPD